MRVYFSHSYRDANINAYFVDELDKQGFKLYADQKSRIWCVAKLERYLYELSGFLSIIPRRASEQDQLTYSPYIGYELELARRSRVPRLLFVDDEVLNTYRSHFPADAVPFFHASPASRRFRHQQAIEEFKSQLEKTGSQRDRRYKDRQATVIAAGGRIIHQATEEIIELLDDSSYHVQPFRGKKVVGAFDDVTLFETLLSSELCVFLLDARLTYADVMLAMAHAHSIPSIRLQYEPRAIESQPALSGRIPWSKRHDMVAEFKRQLDSFRQDFVEAIEMAQASSAVEAMRSIGTTQWTPGPEHSWDPRDGPGLIRHINPSHPFIRDEVDRVRRMIGKGFVSAGRAEALDICVYLYNELKRHHIVYELEPQTLASGTQAIRTVTEILGGKAATCIDLACLFAALLKAAAQRPVLAVFEVKEYVHALAGYRAPNSILWDQQPSLGDLRAAVAPEDLILFEATGAAESDQVVAFETVQERCNGEKMLDFLTAKDAATRLIKSDVRLRYVVDVV